MCALGTTMSDLNKRKSLQVFLSNNSLSETDRIIEEISIENLCRSPFQPRKDFDNDSLNELALSIKKQGIIQPIIVRKNKENSYEIIAGERRWQAAKIANLKTVPCIVNNFSDNDCLKIAIIENLQREDLNIIEEAEALLRLCNALDLKQDEVGELIGKSRSAVSNIIRLNNLHDDVKEFLRRNELEMGHARTLLTLSLEDQVIVAKIIIQNDLSVRATENYVKKYKNGNPNLDNKTYTKLPNLNDLCSSFSNKLNGCKVKITQSGENKGKVILNFSNETELECIKKFFSNELND